MVGLLKQQLRARRNKLSDDGSQNEFANFFRRIFGGAFRTDEEKKVFGEKFRAFTKWYFDLLKNIVLISSLLFLAKKSDSKLLIFIATMSGFLLFLHIESYLDPYGIVPTKVYGRRWLNIALVVLINVIFYVPLVFGTYWYLPKLIDVVAQSYLSQTK